MINGQTVLVVEDEFLIRMGIAEHLSEMGYHVLEAGNAEEALRHLETNAQIRLIFTDIDMPGSMDGLMLARAVADRWPPVRIIVTSGHINATTDEMPKGSEFFAKPYSYAALAASMERLLA